MRGYESQRIARFASRSYPHPRPEVTMAEVEAHVYIVTLTGAGNVVSFPVIAYDEQHAIDVGMERHGDPEDVEATAGLLPCLNEVETIARLMIGEPELERLHRRQKYATRPGSVT